MDIRQALFTSEQTLKSASDSKNNLSTEERQTMALIGIGWALFAIAKQGQP